MKLGIALSGGGIRGLAHAGVLKALEENDIKVDIIGGTSSGSIVATLYAMGFSPYYIYILTKKYAKKIVQTSNIPIISEIGNFIFNKKFKLNGLKENYELEKAFDDIATKKGIKKLEDLKMPLLIPTVDISNSKEYIFTSQIPNGEEKNDKYITDIPIGKAVRCSCNFPVVFSPCNYDNHIFMDAGILNNIAACDIKKLGAEKIISIKFDSDNVTNQSNIMDILMKSLDIMGNKMCEESLKISDMVITIPSDGTGLLDTDKIDMCYEAGYKVGLENMQKIKQICGL